MVVVNPSLVCDGFWSTFPGWLTLLSCLVEVILKLRLSFTELLPINGGLCIRYFPHSISPSISHSGCYSPIYCFLQILFVYNGQRKTKIHDKLFSEVVKSTSDDNKNSSSPGDAKPPLLSGKPIYITNGSSVETKESPKTSSKLSKCSSGNTVDDKAKNEDTIPNAEDKNEPSNEEALDQAKSSAANFPLQESVKEGPAGGLSLVKFMLTFGMAFVRRFPLALAVLHPCWL
ncbi:hypothetical protein V2J09_006735 [Rumex salicifolius]